MGVASGSGWNLWVWLLGVVLRRYIDFLVLLIPTPLVSVLFCSSIPTSFFILLKLFCVLYISSIAKDAKTLEHSVFGITEKFAQKKKCREKIRVDMEGQCRPIRTALPE